MTDEPPPATAYSAAPIPAGTPDEEPAVTNGAQRAHPTSVAIWGVPSPVAAGSRFTVTVGVKCADACRLAGRPVVIRDGTGRDLGRGTLGAEPAAGTRALYAAAVPLTAPPEPGMHAWTAAFPGAEAAEPPADEPAPPPEPATEPVVPHRGAATAPTRKAPATPREAPPATRYEASAPPPRDAAPTPRNDPVAAPPLHGADSATCHRAVPVQGHEAAAAPRHETATCTFSFRTVEPAGNAVTVTVVDRDTEAPLTNADVHLGVYRASTDAEGTARIETSEGDYELYVRSPGYTPYTEPVTVSGDAALRVTAVRVSAADLDDDQVWM